MYSNFSNKFFGMGKLKIWAPEEDDILLRVGNAAKSKKWKKASEQLRKAGFERTDVECRQRYINHLDPSVNKQLWSEQELETLYSKYDEYGNKWFLLQKHLPGRTQTKIKNYFYGTIRYFLKIIVKYFCKKSTGFINDIKTETLLDMYQAKRNFQGCTLIHKTIKKLKFKVDKNHCHQLIRQNQQPFLDFTQQFLNTEAHHPSQLSDSEHSPSENHNILRVQCLPIEPNKVELISSTSPPLDLRSYQLVQLQNMAMNHFRWYEYYQQAFTALQQKADCNQSHCD